MTEVLEEPAISPEELARTARLMEQTVKDNVLAAEMAASPDAEAIAQEARDLAGTPAGFTQLVLKVGIYQWQSDVLSWFENTLEICKGSLCTPNGAGKSSVIVASLALWWITVHPQGRVVITTRDSKQLDNQIWPAIERHKEKFPEFDFIERMVRNRRGGFIVGFTTDDPGRAEGWHKINDTTGPLLIIEDEAKSIPDSIDQATDRCTYNAKFITSSPGLTEGFFYRSHREDQPAPPLGWRHMKVGLADCPHIPKARIDNIIAEYGIDHWFTQSTLFGEFTDADSDTLFVIPKRAVRDLMDNPPNYVPGSPVASCDFAAGRAENVFTVKIGNKIDQHCWKDPDPMRAVYQFIVYFKKYGLTPAQVYGDAGGMGIPIIARFKELGWPINPVNNESEPLDTVRYPNLAAEMWHNAAIKLQPGSYILPNDPILFEQLTTRRAAPTTKAILGLEKKRDMEKRGVKSPDRADGLVMVLAAETDLANTVFDQTGLAKLEAAARAERQPEFYNIDLNGEALAVEKRPDGWLTVYERPIQGFQYIAVLNPCRHEEPLKDHALLVIRAPYWNDTDKKEMPARMVARVGLLTFRLDAKPLAMMVSKIAKWYGRCLVVPIVNDRGDVIERLVDEGVHLYSREEFELLGKGRTTSFEFGWETNDYTRSLWLGALAEFIREDKIKVEHITTVMQLYQLNPKAASEAREAEALGVGLQLIGHATTFLAPRPPQRDRARPKSSQYS